MTAMEWAPYFLATTGAILGGALLDRLIGDPRRLPHLVRGLGRLIGWAETGLRPAPAAAVVERRRGRWLVVIVTGLAGLTATAVVVAAYRWSIWLGLVAETLICCQCLAAKSLRDESTAVQIRLQAQDLAGARQAVSMIVGRDTAGLDESGVTRAAVETVAENTSDGVIAPLMAMAVAGGVGAVVYKAVNTMDSMVGYRNQRYLDFGRAAARLDDLVNWLPSRTAACLMVVAAGLAGQDWRQAWRIWRRDRRNHASPNSAHTEAACAGALGLRLGGPLTYGGQSYDKPLIGDQIRPLNAPEIVRANQLMSLTAWLGLGLTLIARLALLGMMIYATR